MTLIIEGFNAFKLAQSFKKLTEAYSWCFANAQGPCTIVCCDPYEWITNDNSLDRPSLHRVYPDNFYLSR